LNTICAEEALCSPGSENVVYALPGILGIQWQLYSHLSMSVIAMGHSFEDVL